MCLWHCLVRTTNQQLLSIPQTLDDVQTALPQIYPRGQSHGLAPTSAKERDVGPAHKFAKPDDGLLSLSGATGQLPLLAQRGIF